MSSNEVERVQSLFDELIRTPLITFPSSRYDPLDVPTDHGVYVVEDAEGNVLHVERTKDGGKGLQQRLHDHMLAMSSFAWSYVREEGNVLCGVCKFRYVLVSDPRERGFLECYAIGRLCPKHSSFN
jgi:hypothetical protein